MKTKQIKIDGKTYEVRELTMEEGIPLISTSTGRIDTAGMIRAATTIDGVPAKEGEISFAAWGILTPLVMELNSFSGGDEGNG